MSDDILETIDHALDDWATSGDAMRWTPEPPQEYFRATSFDLQPPSFDMRAAIMDAAQKIARLSDAMQPEPDPRQRALDARRNRGTGPAARRLDGRRA